MRGPSGRPAALLGHKGLVVLFAVLIVLAVPAWSGPWDGPWDGPWNGPWIGPGSGWWSGAGTARAQGLQFGVHVAGEAGSFWWHLPLAASLGAGMAPLEFRWDLVEPVPGRFEWARFDAAVEAARASGMRLVGVLHYPAGLPPLSRMSRPGWPSAHVDDWDYFVERVASRYGGEIEDWIVVRGRAGRRDPILGAAEADLDAQLVRTTAAALKRTQPRARLLASVPGADLRWLEVFMARGGLVEVDGLALEVNRWPAGPEGLERVIADVRALAAAAGAAPELWVWRFGYPTHAGLSTTDPRRPGVTPEEQAVYVVKTHAILASAGVSAVLWDELVDGGPDPADARANFGLYESVGRGKPAAFAYATMTRMLADLRYGWDAAAWGWDGVPGAEGGASAAEEGVLLVEAGGPGAPGGAGPEPGADGAGPGAAGTVLNAEGAVDGGAVLAGTVLFDANAFLAEARRQGVYVHAYPFSGRERLVVIVWTSRRPGPQPGETVLWNLDRRPVRVYDMFGERLNEWAPAAAPLYIESALEF